MAKEGTPYVRKLPYGVEGLGFGIPCAVQNGFRYFLFTGWG